MYDNRIKISKVNLQKYLEKQSVFIDSSCSCELLCTQQHTLVNEAQLRTITRVTTAKVVPSCRYRCTVCRNVRTRCTN